MDPFNKQTEEEKVDRFSLPMFATPGPKKCVICEKEVNKTDSFNCFNILTAERTGGYISRVCLKCLLGRVDITNYIDYISPDILILLKRTLDKVAELEKKIDELNWKIKLTILNLKD